MLLEGTDLIVKGRGILLSNGQEAVETETQVQSIQYQHGRWVVKLEGIDSIDDAERWVGGQLSIPLDELPPPPEGSFFGFDLEGCEVRARGESLGTVTRTLDYGGTTLLEVDREGRELLIPFARDYVRQIDVESKRIEVELPEGLLELNN
jgi:16S rRNA processing protein RimM